MSIEVLDDFTTTDDTTQRSWRHVRVISTDRELSLEDFVKFVETRWPGVKSWRRKPMRECSRDFESDTEVVKLYARFSLEIPYGQAASNPA